MAPSEGGRRSPGCARAAAVTAVAIPAEYLAERLEELPVDAIRGHWQEADPQKRAGYKTTSKTFGIQVATTLAKADGFKKLGRGQYKRVGGG